MLKKNDVTIDNLAFFIERKIYIFVPSVQTKFHINVYFFIFHFMNFIDFFVISK